jgi:hypothetical protein
VAGETNDELARRIEHLGTDLHDDLSRIELQLSRLVPREVYDANREADKARITNLESRADTSEAERKRDVKAAAERQAQMMRWVIAMVVVPLLSIVVNFWLSTRGVKP